MCVTCPFRGRIEPCRQTLTREEVMRILHDESIKGPSGWETGECHDRVGEPCEGYWQETPL